MNAKRDEGTFHILIFGAAGTGATTLAEVLSDEMLDCPHVDLDEYMWLPSDPPYQERRSMDEVHKLVSDDIREFPAWIISTASVAWLGDIESLIDLAVFLWLPPDLRIARLERRELLQLGSERVASGGDLHEQSQAFLHWASQYDNGSHPGWDRASHEQWIQRAPCPVLRLEEDMPVAVRIDRVRLALFDLKEGRGLNG
ncbi:MAG: AAA family ATPase [Candidatus Hydrogenedentes bacterium]|nr:AAA family ATPase [Candidatus Hydrogenedentota bacterium]